MKKLYLKLCSFLFLFFAFAVNVFAEAAEVVNANGNFFVDWFYKYGGWQVVIVFVSFIII